jgi:pimeloyl-ACP methyl ester carboxylesterase
MWGRQAPALAAAGYRAINCDLPGHGAAERPARTGTVYTTAELATSLLGVMDEAGIDRGVLVGFSLGGGVALQVALDRPARVPSPSGRLVGRRAARYLLGRGPGSGDRGTWPAPLGSQAGLRSKAGPGFLCSMNWI